MGLYTVVASNGEILPIESLAVSYTYKGSTVETATVQFEGTTYVQTYTSDDGNILSVSKWVAQP